MSPHSPVWTLSTQQVCEALSTSEKGLQVTMVTGDYGLTAQAIARELGIVPNDQILTRQLLCHLLK
jgi:magnesium-transporting ATPase (P-type)